MLYILIVLAIVLVEYKIKNYIEENKKLGDHEDILQGKVTIRKHYNKGAFLNFMENKKEIVKTISCVFLGLILLLFALVLPRKGNKLMKFGLSLLLGGAISNVYDRIHRGYVVDYFSINFGKLKNVIFNIADFAIMIGSLLVFIASIFTKDSTINTNDLT
ncbi:signal peptidase II [Lachnospiraceae bacterium MD1]|uniref:Lipoprotein signal peptidase n=1 Tax=Variimorphobacter saccharofermentans TaxID=2755051 RepID=A0A839K692_9FIRM|nr:signal peptidase II [Variimorphobacter saccharofermentans]MBB2184181.1 signal peptidase II [Variimorphobacter saccharofermentans]